VATTVIIAVMAQEVGGDLVDLRGLVPAGADPHEFEPKASDLRAIERAQLILRHGLQYDDWLTGTLSAGTRAKVVTTTSGIAPYKMREGVKLVDDPHVWHDPEHAKRMVQNVTTGLTSVAPVNRAHYEPRAIAYSQRLDAARARTRAILAEIPVTRRKLVTNHDALGYFARAYGLEVVGTVIPSQSTQAEPSAAETAALLDAIRRERVKAIFAESTVNPKLAAALARDAGITIVHDLYTDSLGPLGSGAETVEGMWLHNARKIADALK
jgi:ABC-type Zn uptake system ZnuABC Zn-binding protein ZnuA